MRQTLLTVAFVTQLIAGEDDFPLLRKHFGLGDAQTYYVLVVDSSGDPQMRASWSMIKDAVGTVSKSVDSNSSFNVILFAGDASVIYSGNASKFDPTSFPNKPTGRNTDWGRTLEKVYEICSAQSGVGVVFTLSVCCVQGIDTRDPISPYQDTLSPAWKALKNEFQKKGQDIYFVPVIISNGVATYADLIRWTIGSERRVLQTSVSLYDLKNSIEKVKSMVMREALIALLKDELNEGNIQLKYELKGVEKERLFIVNNYRFLPVEIKKINSVLGQFLELNIDDSNRKYLDGLVIPPRSTKKIEKEDIKGPKKERWDYSLKIGGLWFYFHQTDSIGLNGVLSFDADKEINELGLDTNVKAGKHVIEIKQLNWTTIGGGFLTIIIVVFGLAYSVGKKKSNKINT